MSSLLARWSRVGGLKISGPRPSDADGLRAGPLSSLNPGRRFGWSDETVLLCGTLSGSLPEDRFDVQPLRSDEQDCVLIADLRLDNRASLVHSLGLSAPETLADATILARAWERWGEACLPRLIGAFAFVVWMPVRQQMFAARDHTGERPLFYYEDAQQFCLASEPAALLSSPGVPAAIDPVRVQETLLLLAPDWHTSFFREIKRVPPGHFLRVTRESCVCVQYWQPSRGRPLTFLRDEEYAEALAEILDQATEARLRTTSPIYSQLSAGLDSSSVTATAAALLARQGRSLTAFTSVPRPGFDGLARPGLLPDEGPAAAAFAAHFPNLRHERVDSEGYGLVDQVKLWSDAMQEPPFNPINYLWATAILDRIRAHGPGVLLTGVIGNATLSFETMFGLADYLRRGRLVTLARTVRSLRAGGAISWRQALAYSVQGMLPLGALRRVAGAKADRSLEYTLLRPELLQQTALREKLEHEGLYQPTTLAAMHALFFRRSDTATDRFAALQLKGVEVRDPTGDRRMWEFIHAVPAEQFIAGGQSRSLARRAMRGRLPAATVSRTLHGHQGADWYLVVRQALPALRLEWERVSESALVQENIDLARAKRLMDTFPESGFHQRQAVEAWHLALTRGMSMATFLRDFDPALQARGSHPFTASL